MWLLESAVSSSGEITSSIEKISDVFTTYTEFPSHGFNQLYKAQRYGKWFVLKGLKPEHQQETVYKRLLVKEFELGVQMDHPNIVRTFSYETDPVAGPVIVMEYVDGMTLKEFLKQNPSRQTRLKIAEELLSAMDYYHSKQIIHRDLKPDNILITNNGHNVKLIDFGLADTDYHGILKQPAGSEKYAAPEQKSGELPLDNRADLYAFGVILRQLFPHDYSGVARKCMQYDREKRYNNAEEVLQGLKHRQAFIPILVFAVLLCVAAGAWALLSRLQNNQAETITKETEGITASDTSSVNVVENGDVQTLSAVQEEKEKAAETLPQEESNRAEPITPISAKETNNQTDDIYPQISSEVKKGIEHALDTVFRRFWDWEKMATAQGKAPIDKLAEYTQSDFFQNNYSIREQHREIVMNDILRRYPQCEPIREKIAEYYNYIFAKRMIAVGNLVYAWQMELR